jgi:hypothetical protein
MFTKHNILLFKLLKGDTSGIKNILNSINEISQIGQSLSEVKEATSALSELSNETTGSVDISDLLEYREILGNLTTEQQALALSTSGLNAQQAQMVLTYSEGEFATTALSQAEADRILAQSGLLASSKALNAEELNALATKTGLTEVQLKQALQQAGMIVTTEGNVIATKALNEAELEEALRSAGCAEANAAQTASLIAETTAKNAATAATTKFAGGTNLLIGAFSKLKGIVVAHPILAVLAAITAGVVTFIGHEKKHREEIKEISEEVISDYENTIQKLTSNKDEFNNISKEYVELSKGVDSLGRNVSLTSDEYDRYHEIANKIADITPDLVKSWDDQGNAILNVKDNLEDLSEAYKQATIDANNSVIAKGPELLENSTEKLVEDDLLASEDWTYQERINNLKELLSKKNRVTVDDLEKFKTVSIDSNGIEQVQYGDLYSLLQNAGINTSGIDWSKGADDYIKVLNNLSETERAALDTYVTKTEASLSENLADRKTLFKSYLQNKLLSDSDYNNISENLQDTLFSLTDALDNSVFERLDTEDKIVDYVNDVLNAFNGLSDASMQKVEAGINLTTEWNNDEISYDEYVEKITAFIDLINELFGDNPNLVKSIKVLFDIPDEEDLANKQDVFVNRLGEQKVSSKDNTSKAGMPSDVENKLKSQGTAVADKWYDSLTKSQREFVDNVSDEDLAEAVKFDSTEQFDEWLQKLQDKAEIEAEVNFNEADAVDSMADLKTAVGSLGDLYAQTVTKTAADGLATGFADPALMNSVETAFGKFSEKLEKEGNSAAANEINKALQDFETTLVEFPNDAEKAQDAIDTLITKYIDQTDIIKNLKEENAEWSKEQLKNMGITNAEEVVQSRLNKQVKATQKAINALASAFEKYDEALNGTDEEKKAEAIAGLVTPTKNALTIRDTEGNALQDGSNDFIDNINSGFVEAHLADVQAMAEGDVEALNRVRLAAAKGAAMEVTTNVPTEVAEAQIADLMDMVAQADAMNIEPGADIDDTAFIQKLNEMINSGQITAEAVNAAFGTMGYEAKWISNKTPIKVPETEGGRVTSIYDGSGSTVHWKFREEIVDFPSLQVITKKGSSGAGVKADYSGTPKSTTGGGGGGGSDNTNKDNVDKEEAESFDWIEVAIQRLEEEINRLDKTVGNVYKNWSKRNNALTDEINKVTKEIKAQELAASEYARNATHVSSSGEVLTDKQIQKQANANSAWTTKLQERIINNEFTNKKVTEKKNKKGKKVKKVKYSLNTKKLQKELGAEYNSYIKDAAQELFDIVAANNKKSKKKKKKLTVANTQVVVADSNKPKKKDYDNTKQYKADLKQYKAAQQLWASGEYQQKIREGQMSGDDIEMISNKYLKQAISQYKEIYQKEVDAKDAAEDLRIKLSELNKQRFDNIATQFDEVISVIEGHVNDIEERISRVEEAGYFADSRLIKENLAQEQEIYKNLVSERDSLINQLNEQVSLDINEGGVEPFSEAWYEMYNKIQDVNTQIEQSITNTIKLNNELKKLQWDKFDYLQERIKRINDEADYLIKFLSYKDLYDDQGNYTDRAWANAAILAEQFNAAEMEAQRYAKAINDFKEGTGDFSEHKFNPYNKDDIEELEKLTDGYRSAKEEVLEFANANKDLVEGAINKNLEALKELIDEYKESLSAAKDLYETQKNITNQTDNIEKLQKQLQAYSGDNSEEGRKRQQELRKQLQDAEQQLQETEWDKYISQTNEMLDNLYEDYEDFLNGRLDDVLVLMNDEITSINTMGKEIKAGLTSVMSSWGVSVDSFSHLLDDNFENIAAQLKNGSLTSDVTETKKNIDELVGYYRHIMDTQDSENPFYELFKNSRDLVYNADGHVALKVTDVTADLQKAQTEKNLQELNERQNEERANNGGYTLDELNALATVRSQKETLESSLKTATGVLSNIQSERDSLIAQFEKEANKKKPNQKLVTELEQAIRLKTNEYNAALANIASLKESINQYAQTIANLESKANGYATGSHYIPYSQAAWTQEQGGELIYRTTDGAILTPLNQGDMVFTNEMSQRLWELAKGEIPIGVNDMPIAGVNSVQTNVTANNEITIVLPNVQDYDSFKKSLQNDPRFEKWMEEVTIGRIYGNNSLNKRKY